MDENKFFKEHGFVYGKGKARDFRKYKIGSRVKIRRSGSQYNDKKGTIVSIYEDSNDSKLNIYTLRIDKIYSPEDFEGNELQKI
mgnify:CR=1 FL=1